MRKKDKITLFLYIRRLIPRMVGLLIWLIGGFPTLVYALPQGGQIVAGSGNIQTPASGSMVVNQNTGQMITNWNQFNIGKTESVQFVQPNSSSVALNRVNGVDPSSIFGKLSANGQVFISNPSGVIFGADSQVNVGGIIATTLNISDQDFLNRNYRFSSDLTKPPGSIINDGFINASGGYVGLLAPSVQNRGTITANLGSVALGAGKAATLDFTGEGLISFAITDPVSGTVTDSLGNVLVDRILNSGTIQANGGRVTLTARDAGDVINNVVNNSGTIVARSIVNRNGEIYLSGGEKGIVSVTGTIDASGKDSGQTGGTVQVTGEKVGLFNQGTIDVSGNAGGGTVLFGGDQQGSGNIPRSTYAYIDSGTAIRADALGNGNGGKLVVFSTDGSRIYGQLSARGGVLSGNGGFIETSGKKFFEITTLPDITAAKGKSGQWLIDPDNIDIVAGSGSFSVNSSSPFTSTNYTSSLGVNLLLAALTGGASVTVTTANSSTTSGTDIGIFGSTSNSNVGYGDITLRTPLNYVGTGSNSLTFNALRNINILDNIYTSGTSSADKLNLTFNTNQGGGGTGTLYVAAGKTVNTNGGGITISATALNLTETNINHEWTPTSYLTANISGTSTSITSLTTGGVLGYGIPAGATGTLAAGSENIYIYPSIAGETIGLGGGAGTFSIPNTVLANISTTGGLIIGDTAGKYGGNITVDGVTSSALANITGGVSLYAVSSTDHSSITFSGTASTFPEALIVNADRGININTNLTTSGNFTAYADYNQSGNASSIFTVASGSTLKTSGNNIKIDAYGLSLPGNLNSGSGTTTIYPSLMNETIGIGAGTGTFSIPNSALANITANGLFIGDGAGVFGGNITVNGVTSSALAHTGAGVSLNALSSTNHPSITFSGSASTFPGFLDLNADRGIIIAANLTTLGTFAAYADYNNSGNASNIFTVASGNTLNTSGNFLGIQGYGLNLAGSINAGAGNVTILPSVLGETIGVGSGTGTFFISNPMLANITTIGGLVIGWTRNGNITVDGVTSSSLANVTGGVTLIANNPTNHPNITFSGTASTIPEALTLQADRGININTNLTTSGNFTGKADFNSSGNASSIFTIASGSTLTTTGNIAITSSNSLGTSASVDSLVASGSCTWNGTSCGTSSTLITALERALVQLLQSTYIPPFIVLPYYFPNLATPQILIIVADFKSETGGDTDDKDNRDKDKNVKQAKTESQTNLAGSQRMANTDSKETEGKKTTETGGNTDDKNNRDKGKNVKLAKTETQTNLARSQRMAKSDTKETERQKTTP